MGGWMGGWMDGWMEGKAGLRIAYSNQQIQYKSSFLVKDFGSNITWGF
jgi:hypothetical protein